MVVTTASKTGPWSLSGKTPTRNRQVCSLFTDLQEDAVTVFFTLNKIRSWKTNFADTRRNLFQLLFNVCQFVQLQLYSSCDFKTKTFMKLSQRGKLHINGCWFLGIFSNVKSFRKIKVQPQLVGNQNGHGVHGRGQLLPKF